MPSSRASPGGVNSATTDDDKEKEQAGGAEAEGLQELKQIGLVSAQLHQIPTICHSTLFNPQFPVSQTGLLSLCLWVWRG